MAPFVVAGIIAVSLFGTGTVVKPADPMLGTMLQGAGVGTLAGGAIGTIGGVGAALGTTTLSSTVGLAGGLGGILGAGTGYAYNHGFGKR